MFVQPRIDDCHRNYIFIFIHQEKGGHMKERLLLGETIMLL